MLSRLYLALFGRKDFIDLDCAQGNVCAVTIRRYAPQDFEACRELYAVNEPGRFPEGHLPAFENALGSSKVLFLIAERDGKLCACAGVSVIKTGTYRAHLCYGLVMPESQGQGIGTALLLARLSLLPEDLGLVTLYPVAASQGFYARFNFRQFGIRTLPNGLELAAYYTRVSPDSRSQCECLLANANVRLQLASASVPEWA